VDLNRILNDIEPPPGGLFSLRIRMRKRARHRIRLRIICSGLATLVLLSCMVWSVNLSSDRDSVDLLANGGAVALGSRRSDDGATIASPDASSAFVPVVTEGDVLFYEQVSF